MGAPVVAYCRIDDAPIRIREPISEPDAVVVQDATLLHHVELFAGLASRAYVLINTSRTSSQLGLDELGDRFRADRMQTLPATEIARTHTGRPVPNTCLLGGLAGLTGIVSIGAVERAVRERFPAPVADANIAAAHEAFERLRRPAPDAVDA
jgi:pyruvate ferredoxin oxidoreductase gamma subunit